MPSIFSYDKGAAGFDQTFGQPMRQFIPTLLRLAHVAPGQRVLDVATGTGAAAELALDIVGPSGHVVAVDIAAPMLDEAQKHLRRHPNVEFHLQDAQALSFPAESFDTVLCSMALHLMSDRRSALAGFLRVLRPQGYAAASINTTVERGLTSHVRTALARVVPEKAERIAAERAHALTLSTPDQARGLFQAAGFRDVTVTVKTRTFTYQSFDAYYRPIAEGGGPWGAEHAELSPEVRDKVRRETLRIITGQVEETGSVRIPVDILFMSGRK
jgi:ubiquinone/menaquinone biosynthesis C-methylase UbiE